MSTINDEIDFPGSSSLEILSESEDVPDTFDHANVSLFISSIISSAYRKHVGMSPKPFSNLQENADVSENIKTSPHNSSEKTEDGKMEEEKGANSSPKEDTDNVGIEDNCSDDMGNSQLFETETNKIHSIELYAYWKYLEKLLLEFYIENPNERFLNNKPLKKILTFDEFQKKKVEQSLHDMSPKKNSESEENGFKRSIQLSSNIVLENECFLTESYEDFEIISMPKDIETQCDIPDTLKSNSITSEVSQSDYLVPLNTSSEKILMLLVQDFESFIQKARLLNSKGINNIEVIKPVVVNKIERSLHDASIIRKDGKNEYPTIETNSSANSSPKEKNCAKKNCKSGSKNSRYLFIDVVSTLGLTLMFIHIVKTLFSECESPVSLGLIFGVCYWVYKYFLLLDLKNNGASGNRISDTKSSPKEKIRSKENCKSCSKNSRHLSMGIGNIFAIFLLVFKSIVKVFTIFRECKSPELFRNLFLLSFLFGVFCWIFKYFLLDSKNIGAWGNRISDTKSSPKEKIRSKENCKSCSKYSRHLSTGIVGRSVIFLLLIFTIILENFIIYIINTSPE